MNVVLCLHLAYFTVTAFKKQYHCVIWNSQTSKVNRAFKVCRYRAHTEWQNLYGDTRAQTFGDSTKFICGLDFVKCIHNVDNVILQGSANNIIDFFTC